MPSETYDAILQYVKEIEEKQGAARVGLLTKLVTYLKNSVKVRCVSLAGFFKNLYEKKDDLISYILCSCFTCSSASRIYTEEQVNEKEAAVQRENEKLTLEKQEIQLARQNSHAVHEEEQLRLRQEIEKLALEKQETQLARQNSHAVHEEEQLRLQQEI